MRDVGAEIPPRHRIRCPAADTLQSPPWWARTGFSQLSVHCDQHAWCQDLLNLFIFSPQRECLLYPRVCKCWRMPQCSLTAPKACSCAFFFDRSALAESASEHIQLVSSSTAYEVNLQFWLIGQSLIPCYCYVYSSPILPSILWGFFILLFQPERVVPPNDMAAALASEQRACRPIRMRERERRGRKAVLNEKELIQWEESARERERYTGGSERSSGQLDKMSLSSPFLISLSLSVWESWFK